MAPDELDRQSTAGNRPAGPDAGREPSPARDLDPARDLAPARDLDPARDLAPASARDREPGRVIPRATVLIWSPVVVLAVLLVAGWVVEPAEMFDPPWLFVPLNLVFLTLVPAVAAAFAVAAYRHTGAVAILALGAGMLATAIGCGLLPAFLLYTRDANATVTIHDSSAVIAAGCQFVAAGVGVLGLSFGPNRSRQVAIVYGAVAALVLMVLGLYIAGDTQVFWTADGPTEIRQATIFAAVALAALAATLWWETLIRDPTIGFLDWYVPGLLLLTLGLAAVFAQSVVGGLVAWIGRGGQYAAAAYMLIAVAAEAPSLRTRSGRALGVSLLQAALPLRPLVDSTSEAVIVTGRRGRVLYWNEAARRIFGYEPGQAFDREASALMLGPGAAQDRRAALNAVLARSPEAATYGKLVNLSHADGTDFPAELTVFANPSDRRLTVCIVSDVSDRVRSHEELEARVLERTAQLEALNGQLESALAAKDEFLGLVSHELKTPITSILAAGAMLKRRLIDADEDFLVEDLLAESSRLAGIIDNLLALARLDVGQQPEREPIVLDRVLRTAVRAVLHQYPDRTIDIVSESGVIVDANPDQLAMVLQNYLANALKYSPRDTSVEAAISARDGRAVVAVKDRGIGIEREDMGRLYEPFYRGDGASKAAGMGIGLTVCRRIVESLGGTVTAAARPGGGSIFSFTLPLTRVDLEEHGHQTAGSTSGEVPAGRDGRQS